MILTVFVSVLLSQANAFSPQKTCEICQTKTFIADPLDCAGYYYCEDGAIGFQGKCDDGQYFNSYKGACDWKDNVECSFGTSVCENVASATYKHDPNSCSSYIYCDGKGNTLRNSCPPGQDFDLDSISCKWALPDSCAGEACELVPNNKFVGYSTKIDENGNMLYGSQTCYNGKGTQNWCPVGYIYNSQLGQCEYNTNQKVKVDCSKQVNNFAASPTNCNQYYYCPPEPKDPATPAVTQEPTLLECPQRFHFNAAQGSCVLSWLYKPDGTNANCDRCGGWKSGYFVLDPSKPNCQNYLFCSNGSGNGATDAAAGVGQCTGKFPFYSEEVQACVGTKPKTPFC